MNITAHAKLNKVGNVSLQYSQNGSKTVFVVKKTVKLKKDKK